MENYKSKKLLIVGNGFDINLGIPEFGKDSLNDYIFKEENIKERMQLFMETISSCISNIDFLDKSEKTEFLIFMSYTYKNVPKKFIYNLAGQNEKEGIEEFSRPFVEFFKKSAFDYFIVKYKEKMYGKLVEKIIKQFLINVLKEISQKYNLANLLTNNEKEKISKKIGQYDSIITFNYTAYLDSLNISNTKVQHIHGTIDNNDIIIGGLDKKDDQKIIKQEIMNLKISDEYNLLEIDIFGFSFTQDEEIFKVITSIQKETEAWKNVIVRYYFYCESKHCKTSNVICQNCFLDSVDNIYEMLSDRYSYLQKKREKELIYYNFIKNTPFLFNRFNKKGAYNRYWLFNSPLNQENYKQNWFSNIFSHDSNGENVEFVFYVVDSNMWIGGLDQ